LAYIGNTPAESFASFAKQVFTIVNSQTAYTLDHKVTNENDIRLVINNVVQEPGSGKAYTASGTTLTLSAALTNGTDTMYCVFLGRALQTVNPPNASVGSAQVADSLISGKTALGATPADTDELLISDAGTLKRVDYSYLKSANTPAFEAYLNATQSVSDNSVTKLTIDTEVYDSDSDYDNSTNYRFTPSVAGKYFVYGSVSIAQGDQKGQIYLYKNGSSYKSLSSVLPTDEFCPITFQAVLDMNGSSDYLELFARVNTSGSGQQINSGTKDTYFGAYRVIGA
jgi:hypothetical protein